VSISLCDIIFGSTLCFIFLFQNVARKCETTDTCDDDVFLWVFCYKCCFNSRIPSHFQHQGDHSEASINGKLALFVNIFFNLKPIYENSFLSLYLHSKYGIFMPLVIMFGSLWAALNLPYQEGIGAKQVTWYFFCDTTGLFFAPYCALLGGPLILRAVMYVSFYIT